MSTMYNGEHSLIFQPTDGSAGKNTWDDWFLIPTSRPTMAIPGAQNRFVEIPGMNGSYDLSDYLTSNVVYSDRSGSFEFIVDNGHADWIDLYRTIMSYLHGRRLRLTLTDDQEWYYEGRFSVSNFQSEAENSKVVINYRVAPFKYSIYSEFASNILWDPFCFERDQDWSVLYHIQSTTTTKRIPIETFGTAEMFNAKLVSGGPVYVTFGDNQTKKLSVVNEIVPLGESNQFGSTRLSLNGNGYVDIGWQKLSL